MRKGSGTFFVYRKFCDESTQSGKRARAGYHCDGGILPFALHPPILAFRVDCGVRPYMAGTHVRRNFWRIGGVHSAGGMIYSNRQIGIQGGSVMRTEKKSHRSRMDPIVALVLIFAVLKVTGLISWSWLWVLSPIWITLLIFAAVFSSILVGGRIVKGKW